MRARPPLFLVAALALTSALLGARDAAAAALPYQGNLVRDAQPQTGTFDFRFALVTDEGADLSCLTEDALAGSCGGWREEHLGVPVALGRFSVNLGDALSIPQALLRDGAPFLAIALRGEGEAWSLLAGRQRLGAAPYALRAEAPVVPIGAVIAWHDALPGVPQTLPDGWARCDGGMITDPESPLAGAVLPNLNGEARFLRGAATAGALQDDQLQTHTHVDTGHTHTYGRPRYSDSEPSGGGDIRAPDTYSSVFQSTTAASAANLGGPYELNRVTQSRHGAETRPKNMGVVWIMRIK